MAYAQKKAEQEERTIVFVDEAGFYLLPMAVRTYVPIGQTPTLRVKLTHDHLSVIGAITSYGQLLFQMQTRSYTSEDVGRFLRLLLRKLPGKLLVIWDGAPIHRSQAVKTFLARGTAKRIHVGTLTQLCPDLNPEEGSWNLLKRRELKHVCCRDLSELTRELQLAKGRLRHQRKTIFACFAHAGCPL